MNGSMIDTNVIIKYLAGDESSNRLIGDFSKISISAIVVGELHYGARKSTRFESNIALFTSFLSNFPIIPIDEYIANQYGEIKVHLYKKGLNIPENDIWIAATAMFRKSQLITYDNHFKSIYGLEVIS